MIRTRYWLVIAAMICAGTSVSAQNTANLTDSQIAHVYTTAELVDIAAANLALRHSANNAVRAFAGATLRDYTAANKNGHVVTCQVEYQSAG
jgi:predicted outer membrane protein